MNSKPRALLIPQDDPFKNDRLDRKGIAENLSMLVLNSSDPLVISINGRFGTGKTSFLKMWIESMRPQNPVIHYLSAWENDFQRHALPVLLAELSEILPSRARAVNKLKKISIDLLKSGLPTAIKLATAGFVDVNEAMKDALSQTATSFAESQISDYLSSKESIVKYKAELSRVALTSGPNAKLIVVIDELDRCRPNFAIEYLEVIKHLFSVDNTVFVLGIDRLQIAESVRTVYGQNFDTSGYLRRFFDLQIDLPAGASKTFVDDLANTIGFQKILEARFRHPELRDDPELLSSAILCLADLFGLTLRDIERVYSLLSVALRTFGPSQYIFAESFVFLAILKLQFPEVYVQVSERQWQVQAIWDWIRTFATEDHDFYSVRDSFGPQIVSEIVRLVCDDRALPSATTFIHQVGQDTNNSQRIKEFSDRVVELVNYRRYRNRSGNELSYLVKKLNFVDRLILD